MRRERNERSDRERCDGSENPEQIHDRYTLKHVRQMILVRQLFRSKEPSENV
jgi:hypothetical protein